MPSTEVIGVLRSDLDSFLEALSRSSAYFGALDLADAVRTGAQQSRTSRNTTMQSKARDRVAAYLDIEEEEDEEDGGDPVE